MFWSSSPDKISWRVAQCRDPVWTERTFNYFFGSTLCSLSSAYVDQRAKSAPITAGEANTLFLWNSFISCTYAQMLLCTYLTEVPGLQHEENWIWNNSWYNRNSKWMLSKMNNTAQCYLNSNGSHRGSSFGTMLLTRKLELLPIPMYLQYT